MQTNKNDKNMQYLANASLNGILYQVVAELWNYHSQNCGKSEGMKQRQSGNPR